MSRPATCRRHAAFLTRTSSAAPPRAIPLRALPRMVLHPHLRPLLLQLPHPHPRPPQPHAQSRLTANWKRERRPQMPNRPPRPRQKKASKPCAAQITAGVHGPRSRRWTAASAWHASTTRANVKCWTTRAGLQKFAGPRKSSLLTAARPLLSRAAVALVAQSPGFFRVHRQRSVDLDAIVVAQDSVERFDA